MKCYFEQTSRFLRSSPSQRIGKIDWQKNRAKGVMASPESYYDVLSKISEIDSQHIIGKGSLSSISPLNEHWQEVSHFDSENSYEGYISAVSKGSKFRAIFDVEYIKQVKNAIGYKGGFEKFLREYSGVMYKRLPQDKQKFYLNDERQNSSGLLIISGQSFYVISPRVDF